ncbi:non-homologous end-joining DNA ligase [Idiomarina seosinensis]|uniref:non-homologous end-joining DNA ligase n=1 Tax=Idiomarina seosinensis TaxID=281739 RepID=UPI00384E5FB3
MTDVLARLSSDDREAAKREDMPDWLTPMKAKLTHEQFSDPDWVYERKLDGERVIAYVTQNGEARLCSRNKKCLNKSYPELEQALVDNCPPGVIVDGEVVAFNDDDISDFQLLQARMKVSNRDEARASNVQVYFYLFDCLYIDGHNITNCSLRGRKKLLKEALQWTDPLRFTAHKNEDGISYYHEACEKGWEGLIAKRANARYAHSRSSDWLKFKCLMQQEFVICGFTQPEGERVGFGALLLGFYRNKQLVYAGDVGTGFDDATLKELGGRLESISRETSPFDKNSPSGDDITFVTPKLVCEIAFTEWTQNDNLRHPRFLGLRRDKKASKVHKETETQKAES